MPALAYSIVAYLCFLVSFVYAVLWLGDAPVVPTTIDGSPGPHALLVDLALLSLFAVQHSGMARPAFKRAWTRVVPRSIERATYVLLSSLCLLFLCLAWRSLPGTVWRLQGAAAAVVWAVYALGWLVAVGSTFMIDHFELLGLRQAFRQLARKPPAPQRFLERWLYRVVRHPIMLGFLIAFWAAPWMSVTRLVFAAATTAYVLVALRFEEHDLRVALGDAYASYQQRVPMLLPRLRRPTVAARGYAANQAP